MLSCWKFSPEEAGGDKLIPKEKEGEEKKKFRGDFCGAWDVQNVSWVRAEPPWDELQPRCLPKELPQISLEEGVDFCSPAGKAELKLPELLIPENPKASVVWDTPEVTRWNFTLARSTTQI